MRRRHAPIALLLLLAALGGCAPHANARGPSFPTRDHAHREPRLNEWRAALREARSTQVARLRSYATAGVFPRNDFQPGVVSMLLDAEGRPCAMAHLVIESGQPDLITRLSREDNQLQFAAVRSGALHEWLLTSGLTREEAAFVQEPDMYFEDDQPMSAAMREAEVARLRAHFTAAAQQIEMNTEVSLDVALERLGDRVYRRPRG